MPFLKLADPAQAIGDPPQVLTVRILPKPFPIPFQRSGVLAQGVRLLQQGILLKDRVKLNAIQSLKYNLIETTKQYFWRLKNFVSYELRGISVEGWGVVVLWWRQGGSNSLS